MKSERVRAPIGKEEPLRLLVVEDFADMRRSLEILFRLLGYPARFAENLDSARVLAAQGPFDVLLSDIYLPDGDGRDLMRELSQCEKRPKTAIAMSGFCTEKDIAASKAAGFDAHLVKPFAPEELVAILQATAAKLRQEGRIAAVPRLPLKRKISHPRGYAYL